MVPSSKAAADTAGYPGEISTTGRVASRGWHGDGMRGENRSRLFPRLLPFSRVRETRTPTHIHTHTQYGREEANGENLARVWHTGLPVKTCEGRHQMLFRTRLSRSAAHTLCLGKIETRERDYMGEGGKQERDGALRWPIELHCHGRLARS